MCQMGYDDGPVPVKEDYIGLLVRPGERARKEPIDAVAAERKYLTFSDLDEVPNLELRNIEFEVYREYDFSGRVYRISDPVGLYYRAGGTTHRIVDKNGVTHCVPAPGVNDCVLRWVSKDLVNF